MSEVIQNIFAVIITVIILLVFWYYVRYWFDFSCMKSQWEARGDHFKASAVVKCEGDDGPVLFVGGSVGQCDVFMRRQDFKVIGTIKKDKAAWSTAAAVGDMNNDGLEDLVIARHVPGTGMSSLHIYYQQNDTMRFSKTEKIIEVPGIISSVALSDINNNGTLEIFVGVRGHANMLLVKTPGTPEADYEDEAAKYGVQGVDITWSSCFVDLNGNGFPDLVVANEGKPQIYSNNYGDSFVPVLMPVPIGHWHGVAVGDFFNTGMPSLFFTNLSSSASSFRTNAFNKNMMLVNKGNYQFDVVFGADVSDCLEEVGVGWGAIATDFDLSGNQSIIAASNSKKLPWSSFRVLRDTGIVLQNMGGQFRRRRLFLNPEFATTALTMDLNDNGLQDIVWINNECSVKGYFLKTDNNWLSIDLPKNAQFANAIVKVTDSSGRVQSKQNILGGPGLGSSGSSVLQFGFGSERPVEVTVHRFEDVKKIEPGLNETIVVT